MARNILHVDMDAFFVSVEQVLDPSLKGKPVIVGGGVPPREKGAILDNMASQPIGSETGRPAPSPGKGPDGRGVVAAASYEARHFGVHSAMPLARARRLCPQAIFLRGAHRRYSEFSSRIFDILETYTPLVESMSLDEGYLDLTGCERLHRGPAEQTAVEIRNRIRGEVGIHASIGMAANKLMAKIASGMAKPNGMLRITPGCEAAFLAPLPIGRIPGIGPKSRERFHSLGIRTVGQLAALPMELLEEVFGEWGTRLYHRARGECDSPVEGGGESKSISRETTLEEDTLDAAFLLSTLSYLTEKAAAQLRAEGLRTRSITLKLRTSDFKTFTRSHTFNEPACEDHVLFHAATDLFHRAFSGRARVRLIGIGFSGFIKGRQEQLDLFAGAGSEHWDSLYQGIDRLRGKYGFKTLLRARSCSSRE